ncbi:MAG: LemA family protein [Candidatus Hydrogenedentes bacterium]|nr:LemA family protein [Candidatus Hydrogenedentota bacterium]
MTPIYIVAGLALVAAVAVIAIYNSLVRLKNHVENAWSQIDVQLKRRHDLIPNLVETVKGYMNHERETLEAVTRARGAAAAASGVQNQAAAENALGGALGRFFVAVEKYPDLKASQNFLALQEELASTENKIGFARQFYNDSVMRLNTKVQMFPSNLVAGVFRFNRAEFFEIDDAAARSAPEVKV